MITFSAYDSIIFPVDLSTDLGGNVDKALIRLQILKK